MGHYDAHVPTIKKEYLNSLVILRKLTTVVLKY